MSDWTFHYRLVRKIGTGGEGEVWLAEARAASALIHPNACTVLEVGDDADGRLLIALEYIEGPKLDAELHRSSLPASCLCATSRPGASAPRPSLTALPSCGQSTRGGRRP